MQLIGRRLFHWKDLASRWPVGRMDSVDEAEGWTKPCVGERSVGPFLGGVGSVGDRSFGFPIKQDAKRAWSNP